MGVSIAEALVEALRFGVKSELEGSALVDASSITAKLHSSLFKSNGEILKFAGSVDSDLLNGGFNSSDESVSSEFVSISLFLDLKGLLLERGEESRGSRQSISGGDLSFFLLEVEFSQVISLGELVSLLLFPLFGFKLILLELISLVELEFLMLVLELVLSVEERIESGGCLGKTLGLKSKGLLIMLSSKLLSLSLGLKFPLLLLYMILELSLLFLSLIRINNVCTV